MPTAFGTATLAALGVSAALMATTAAAREPLCSREEDVYRAFFKTVDSPRVILRQEVIGALDLGFESVGRSGTLRRWSLPKDDEKEAFRIAVAGTGGRLTAGSYGSRVVVLDESILGERGSDCVPLRSRLEPWWSVSSVGFNRNCTRALVYVESWCGGTCGFSDFVLLARDPKRGWEVLARERDSIR